jgi:HSP20 family protein
MMNSTGNVISEWERLMDVSLTRKALLHVSSGHWMPALDIYETEESVMVFVEVAGVKKQDIDVTYMDGYLTITGIRKELCCNKMVTLHRMEIDTGRFHRRIRLNLPIDREKIEAEYKHGILKIILPKERVNG